MPFRSVGLFTAIFLTEGFSFQSLTEITIDLTKLFGEIRHSTPNLFLLRLRQISRETCTRINVLVIEIGFPKKSGPAVPTQTQFQINQIVRMTKRLHKKRTWQKLLQ